MIAINRVVKGCLHKQLKDRTVYIEAITTVVCAIINIYLGTLLKPLEASLCNIVCSHVQEGCILYEGFLEKGSVPFRNSPLTEGMLKGFLKGS